MTAAMMPKAMFWATIGSRSVTAGHLLDLRLGAGLVGLEVGHGLHPLAEPVLVVEQVGDAGLGVLVLGAPEQGVERADLDADAAVHAERVVDVEAVERVDRAGLAALAAGRGLVLVALDVDAPVGALAGAEHADGAVLLLEGDDAAGPGRRRPPSRGGTARWPAPLASSVLSVGCVSPSVTPRPLISSGDDLGIRTPPSGRR